jgi:hypothetical protein
MDTLLPGADRAPPAARSALLELLHECSRFEARAGAVREAFSAACLLALFHLCERNDAAGVLAAPLLLQTCRDVLSRFAADDRTSGSLPLPRVRLVEVSLVLEQLPELQSPMGLFVCAYPTAHGPWSCDATAQPCVCSRNVSAALLLRMYPQLCDCVMTKEADVGRLVAAAMRAVGRELRLDADEQI